MADISAGMVMNGPTPIMLVMFRAVAWSKPKRRTNPGGPSPLVPMILDESHDGLRGRVGIVRHRHHFRNVILLRREEQVGPHAGATQRGVECFRLQRKRRVVPFTVSDQKGRGRTLQ